MKTLAKNILIVLSFLLLNEVVYTQCNSLIINAGSNQAICSGQSVQIGGNPTISNTLSNSTFSFNWSPNSNISNISVSNPTVNPTTTTKYYLYVQQTDSLGVICNAVDSVTVTVNPLPNVILNNYSFKNHVNFFMLLAVHQVRHAKMVCIFSIAPSYLGTIFS